MSRRSHFLVFVAAGVIVVVGLKYAQPFLVPVLFGASLTAISSPIATWVTRRGLPSAVGALAALVVDVALLCFIAVMLMLAGSELQAKVPAYLARLVDVTGALAAALSRRGIPVDSEALTSALHAERMVPVIGDAAMEVAGILSSLAMVLLVVFFTLCEFTGLGDKICRITRDPARALVRIDRVVREVQRYLLSRR
jgi:AI-2 transport protein TqsA